MLCRARLGGSRAKRVSFDKSLRKESKDFKVEEKGGGNVCGNTEGDTLVTYLAVTRK